MYGSWIYNYLITTHVVVSNPAHGDVYFIQQYVKTIVSYMQQVGGFLREHCFLRHDITEILLKMALISF